jgi:hypothetical protein
MDDPNKVLSFSEFIKKSPLKEELKTELSEYNSNKIDPNAIIKTDEWTGYKPLSSEFKNLKRVKSGKKKGIFKICIE